MQSNSKNKETNFQSLKQAYDCDNERRLESTSSPFFKVNLDHPTSPQELVEHTKNRTSPNLASSSSRGLQAQQYLNSLLNFGNTFSPEVRDKQVSLNNII